MGAIKVNGSTLIDMVKLAPLQEALLKKPDKALTEHLDFKEFADGLPMTCPGSMLPARRRPIAWHLRSLRTMAT